jgi:hypothetical protein
MYEYVVEARRVEDDSKWLPIACNTYADAQAMFDHVLTRSGGYDVARMAKRRGTSNVFVEIARKSRFSQE